MSINPGHARYLGGPTPFVTDPLEQGKRRVVMLPHGWLFLAPVRVRLPQNG
jgi:hypothetical protein